MKASAATGRTPEWSSSLPPPAERKLEPLLRWLAAGRGAPLDLDLRCRRGMAGVGVPRARLTKGCAVGRARQLASGVAGMIYRPTDAVA